MKRTIYNPNETPEESRRNSDEFVAMLNRWASEPEFECDLSVIEVELDTAGFRLCEPDTPEARVRKHGPVA